MKRTYAYLPFCKMDMQGMETRTKPTMSLLFMLALLTICARGLMGATSPAAKARQAPAWAEVERIGPPNQNFIDVERYRFSRMDITNATCGTVRRPSGAVGVTDPCPRAWPRGWRLNGIPG